NPIWWKSIRVKCKYNSLLSFHTFPSDAEIRRKWLVAIRRDKFTVTPHTRVCSRHFNKDDVREPLSETGRRLLNKGAVPALFEWNNFTLPTSRPGVWERRERPSFVNYFV
uniref:THAP domain-containing protein 1 n=1 Tax=Oryzias sinensis TaxID=183150 RepID=A0A8C7WP63_9TELE